MPTFIAANAVPPTVGAPHDDLPELIGDHPLMQRLRALIRMAARSGDTTLVMGEPGTGKELVAKGIHALSRRRTEPMVTFNSSTLTSETAVSQLFGHLKGAFTGAHRDHPGYFRAAHEGVLFVDEVGELPWPVQAMFLRAIEYGEILPLGATRALHVDAQVVAATNVDLNDAVRAKLFRLDLLTRLKGTIIRVPALRERMSDLPRLADYFLALEGDGRRAWRLSDGALNRLMEHDFPGNVRDVKMAVHRACVNAEDRSVIAAEDLLLDAESVVVERITPLPRLIEAVGPPPCTLGETVCHALAEALDRAHGNQSVAARQLGVSRSMVRRFVQTGQVKIFGGGKHPDDDPSKP